MAPMATILCPTRGGTASVPAQEWAIDLARRMGADLVFLYVSNTHFLDRFSYPRSVDISAELDELGEFLLAMAQDRAENAGIPAQTVVRQGEFREQLADVIREHNVSIVVIGLSRQSTGVLTETYRTYLSRSLLEELGVEVYVIGDGQVMEHYAPNDA
ncbi:MAG: universal stress protein [Anaerolineales bacterium]|nr:universal stress protein [Anaerolineales bacterium]MCB8952855.1 universal stress protein [Ardenticatenales bacterium]